MLSRIKNSPGVVIIFSILVKSSVFESTKPEEEQNCALLTTETENIKTKEKGAKFDFPIIILSIQKSQAAISNEYWQILDHYILEFIEALYQTITVDSKNNSVQM